MNISEELKKRIRNPEVLGKVCTAKEAASFIKPDITLGVSGFGKSGYTTVVAKELAARAEAGEKLTLTVYSGASVGDEFDGVLTRAGALCCRMPYQNNKDLRDAINDGKVKYVDLPISVMAKWVRSNYLNHIDVALVEAAAIDENGNIIPTLSVGATETYVACADKVIVELNTQVPACVEGIHDIYIPEPAPYTKPINILKSGDRIGTPYIPCGPSKIVAVVESDVLDCGIIAGVVDDEFRKMSENLISFLKNEVKEGRLCNPLPPLQAGIGAVSDAVIQGLKESDFTHLNVFSEIVQGSFLTLADAGKIDSISGAGITMSQDEMKEFYKNIERYRDKLVLRPMEISNSHEVIRRLGVIAINTAIEADLYGNVNSSYIGGTRLMNGVGGSGDFCQNAGVSIFITKSTAKNGRLSSIVPIVSHIDHTSKNVQILITEQGVADLRGLDVIERADLIIDKCAHPKFRKELKKYLSKAIVLSEHLAYPYSEEAAMMFHNGEMEV
ncbi:MAG: acetyl-CoA hydrolase [Spirochaetia bacterium]|nr:acetyl-CoA hydrolase [Spirochaetia bacterium]